jgi:hypothetical protein
LKKLEKVSGLLAKNTKPIRDKNIFGEDVAYVHSNRLEQQSDAIVSSLVNVSDNCDLGGQYHSQLCAVHKSNQVPSEEPTSGKTMNSNPRDALAWKNLQIHFLILTYYFIY